MASSRRAFDRRGSRVTCRNQQWVAAVATASGGRTGGFFSHTIGWVFPLFVERERDPHPRQPAGPPFIARCVSPIQSQCGRASADLSPTNRPDAHLKPALANKANKKSQEKGEAGAVIPSAKRQNEYQPYRSGPPERSITISSMPVLVAAAMIAAAILLSTLLSAIGTRYIGIEGPNEESTWLVDRLTGRVYRCEAAQRGKAACDLEIPTGSIPERPKPQRDNGR